jgi:hypothetical protein
MSSNRYAILTQEQPEESITFAKLSVYQYVYKKFRNASVILKTGLMLRNQHCLAFMTS